MAKETKKNKNPCNPCYLWEIHSHALHSIVQSTIKKSVSSPSPVRLKDRVFFSICKGVSKVILVCVRHPYSLTSSVVFHAKAELKHVHSPLRGTPNGFQLFSVRFHVFRAFRG